MKKRYIKVNGMWQPSFTSAVQWTYAISGNIDDIYTWDMHTYSLYAYPSRSKARVVQVAVTYTFSEGFIMPVGSSFTIYHYNDYPTQMIIYVNGDANQLYNTWSSDEVTKTINWNGVINSIKIFHNFNNTSGENFARIKVNVNSAGSNSFMLNDACSAQL